MCQHPFSTIRQYCNRCRSLIFDRVNLRGPHGATAEAEVEHLLAELHLTSICSSFIKVLLTMTNFLSRFKIDKAISAQHDLRPSTHRAPCLVRGSPNHRTNQSLASSSWCTISNAGHRRDSQPPSQQQCLYCADGQRF